MQKTKLGAKTIALILVVVMIGGVTIGGTFAWLITETDPVVNTFTYGDINITLTETDTGDNDGNDNTNDYIMIPGKTITKDPKVTVQAGSEESWLFVKVEKSDNFDDFMSYDIENGWTPLTDSEGKEITGVYYREVTKTTDAQKFNVIKDDNVTVSGDVTKEALNALTEETYPTLTVTAYAVQRDADIQELDTVQEAWALAQGEQA